MPPSMIVIGAVEDLSYTNLLALQHQLVTLLGKVSNAMEKKFQNGKKSNKNHVYNFFE